MKIYIDVTRTWESGALTGIQRVAIEYLRELKILEKDTRAVRVNARGLWELTENQTRELLALGRDAPPGTKRGRRWRWSGLQKKITAPTGGVLFAPEVFAPQLPRHLHQFVKTVALVHDLVALEKKEFREYLQALLRFRALVAPSAWTQQAWAGWSRAATASAPGCVVVQHGAALPEGFLNAPSANKKLLCLGSLEPRKNHLNLLLACEDLWNAREKFELQIVGLTTKKGREVEKKIYELKKMGHPVSWNGTLSDAALEKLWQETWALAFPSHEEGFGLPVVEALARGVPVVCGTGGALVERTRAGGCEVLQNVDAQTLARGIGNILQSERREELSAQAQKIKTRSWADAARELLQALD